MQYIESGNSIHVYNLPCDLLWKGWVVVAGILVHWNIL